MAMFRLSFWVLSIIGALAGIYILIQGARKAPTEREMAECATIAIACAMVPYCLARAVSEAVRKN